MVGKRLKFGDTQEKKDKEVYEGLGDTEDERDLTKTEI